MKKVLITGANSYIGMSFEKYVNNDENIIVDTLDMLDEGWNKYDFSKYDTVLHLAAIVHLKEKKNMIDLYNKVNYELAVNVAKKAKEAGIKQFILALALNMTDF